MRSTPPLSSTAARIRAPVFSELQARIDREAAKGTNIVQLQIGDTYLLPPVAVQRVLGDLDGADPSIYRYGATAGLASLREAVLDAARMRSIAVDAETDVLVGNGGTHALFCAARAILDAGDEVLVASPYWPLAPGIFTACGAVPLEVPLTQRLYDDRSRGFDPPTAGDAGAMFRAAVGPRTKAIYVITPNNPDGKMLSRRDLESIAAVAREHDLWVFSDEVYADTVFEGEHVSIAALPGMRDRTIVLSSMSKSHALAGCRVGFAVGPASAIASARRVSTHSGFNVSVVMQNAALAAIRDSDFPVRARATYLEARDAAMRALEGAPIRMHRAEGATYLFLDFAPAFAAMSPEARTARPLLALLERAVDHGVLLAPGDAFGVGYETYARLCFTAAPKDEVVRGIERLRAALDAIGFGARQE